MLSVFACFFTPSVHLYSLLCGFGLTSLHPLLCSSLIQTFLMDHPVMLRTLQSIPCFVFPGGGECFSHTWFWSVFVSVSSYFWYLGSWYIRWWGSVIQFSFCWFQPATCVCTNCKILGPPAVCGHHTGGKKITHLSKVDGLITENKT